MASNSSWHSAAWVDAEKALDGSEKSSDGGKKTGVSCQNRSTAIHSLYFILLPLSYFVWLSCITATDEVWDALVKVWLFLFVILL